jgi:16S rRNA (guanine527-N7)-methyltransferase
VSEPDWPNPETTGDAPVGVERAPDASERSEDRDESVGPTGDVAAGAEAEAPVERGADSEAESGASVVSGADPEPESEGLVERGAYPVVELGALLERGSDSEEPAESGADPEVESEGLLERAADPEALVGGSGEPEADVEAVEPEPDPEAEALFGERAGLARQYAAKLATTGVAWGLIGPAEADRVWERHIVNSVALSELIPQGARVVDVGSGAGLPGIPLALARPDLVVTLLEPSLRRSGFLALTAIELGLDSAVVRARAEDHDEDADVVVARAVAPLGRLVGWTRHLFKRGELLALKGEKAAAEVAAAAATLKRWRLQAEVVTCSPVEGATATVVRVRPKG